MTKPKKNEHNVLDPALANLISDKLIADFNDLCALVTKSMTDKAIQNDIERIVIELQALQKTIQKKREYSPEQVTALATMISKVGHKLIHQGNPDNAFEAIHQKLAALNGGKSPLQGLKVSYDKVDEKFAKNMQEIKEKCNQIGDNTAKLLKHAHGHHHSPMEKLANAMNVFKKSVLSVFKIGMSVAKDAQYYGKRVAAVTGLRELSDADKLETAERTKKKAEKRIEKMQDRIAGAELLRKERELKQNEGKPSIFRKK